MLKRLSLYLLIALLALPFVGCEESAPVIPPVATNPASVETWFPLTIGGKEIKVQLAIDFQERQKGLMGRTSMGDNEGMLFIFERPQKLSFWMKNTPLPLSIGFISPEGVLLESYWMQPYNTGSVSSQSSNLQLALEMKQGWFRANGVESGARLDMQQLGDAMRARGYDPTEYGL